MWTTRCRNIQNIDFTIIHMKYIQVVIYLYILPDTRFQRHSITSAILWIRSET